MGREQLVHEYRRLCITGFRLTTGRGFCGGRHGRAVGGSVGRGGGRGVWRRRAVGARGGDGEGGGKGVGEVEGGGGMGEVEGGGGVGEVEGGGGLLVLMRHLALDS